MIQEKAVPIFKAIRDIGKIRTTGMLFIAAGIPKGLARKEYANRRSELCR